MGERIFVVFFFFCSTGLFGPRGKGGGEGLPFEGQLGLSFFFHYHFEGGRLTTGVFR